MINVTQTELNKELGRMYQIAGQTASDLNFLSNYLITEIFTKQEFKYLQWVEVQLAFKNGVAGDYGKFMGINVNSLAGFIRLYLLSDDKKDFERMKPKQLGSGEDKSQTEIDYLNKNAVIYMLNQNIKEPLGNWFNGNTVTCYDYLVKQGIIRDDYRKFLEQAKNSVLGGYKNEIVGADRHLSQEIRNKISELNRDGNTDQMCHAKILFMKALDLQDLKNKLN